MKSVLISIQPKWVEKIASGKKTIEVRKTKPKLETPFKCYIYYTKKKHLLAIFRKGDYIFSDDHKAGKFDENIFVKGDYYWSGKVIGEFVCDKITDISVVVKNCNENYNHVYHNDECKGSCLTWKELQKYGKGKPLYGWHISDLKIYDKPKELTEFYTRCNITENKCKLCDNCFDREDSYGRHYAVKKLIRPPQSWCYVEG